MAIMVLDRLLAKLDLCVGENKQPIFFFFLFNVRYRDMLNELSIWVSLDQLVVQTLSEQTRSKNFPEGEDPRPLKNCNESLSGWIIKSNYHKNKPSSINSIESYLDMV